MVAVTAPMTSAATPRIAVIDVARGVAILAMVVYHLAWDLDVHGLTDADVTGEIGWVIFARLIAASFLALVGVSLVLATLKGIRWRPFCRRLALIILAAAAVSAGTYWFMPDAFVFFGILHLIAVASVLALPFVRAPIWVTLLAAAFFLAGRFGLVGPLFDAPALWWLGLSPTPPMTVDYVPIFPWFGVVLLGVVAGRLVAQTPNLRLWRWRPTGWPWRLAAHAGRWSLVIYLVHQPILLGLISVIAPLIGPSEERLARRYENRECAVSCAAGGFGQPACEAFCACLTDGLRQEPGILTDAYNNRLSDEQLARWNAHAGRCETDFLPLSVSPGDL